MSTSYSFYCLDCKVEDRWGHNFDRRLPCIQEILAALDGILAFARLVPKDSDLGIVWLGDTLPLYFFREHDGHRIMARSEYGDLHDACEADVTCTSCGHDMYRCQLTRGHDGAHAKDRP